MFTGSEIPKICIVWLRTCNFFQWYDWRCWSSQCCPLESNLEYGICQGVHYISSWTDGTEANRSLANHSHVRESIQVWHDHISNDFCFLMLYASSSIIVPLVVISVNCDTFNAEKTPWKPSCKSQWPGQMSHLIRSQLCSTKFPPEMWNSFPMFFFF